MHVNERIKFICIYNFALQVLVNRICIPLVHYANNQNGDDWSNYSQSNRDVRTGSMSSRCYMRLYIYVFYLKIINETEIKFGRST